jgi:hypothetical protein
MMARLILHLQYKTFNMKFYLVILSFFLIAVANGQIMPQSFISNNNAYPISTSGADVAFNFETDISSAAASPSPPIKSGSSTYPAIKSDFSFNLSNTTPYTLQFLFNKVVSNNTTFGFIGFTTATNGFSYDPASFLFYQFENGVIRNYVKNDYPSNVNVNSFVIGQTYQITTTYNGSQWKHYVNGVLTRTVTNSSTWSGTGNLMLGNIGGDTNIILDEVRFWDRALTQDEITNNYKKPLIGNENGLKLYYNFNNQGNPSENNSNIQYLKDLTSNNNKGTFYNMSLSGTQNNFVPSIAYYDSVVISLDANNLDSYPGTGNASSLIAGGNAWHDLSTKQSLFFSNNLNYNINAAPILNADGGRSLFIKNMYGRSNLNTGITGNSPKSIEAWVKFNSLDNISVTSIGGLSDYNQFELAADNNKLILNIGADFSSNLTIRSNRTLSTNTWYHVVITWSRNFAKTSTYKYGTFTMYINGIRDNDYFVAGNTNIDILSVSSTSTPVYIGTSLRTFNGKLGILKVYRKELLETEVLNRFNATKSRFGY